MNFNGVKAAVFTPDDKLIVYRRDSEEEKPGLRFAGLWDFPGGGREAEETPFECLQREIIEEFGIAIEEDSIRWMKEETAMHDASQKSFFAVVKLSQKQVDDIVFGDEGQYWELATVSDFFDRNDAVPALKPRLQSYFDSMKE